MNVEYVNHMGDDLTVVNAARVSMDKESSWWTDNDWVDVLNPQDRKLISYLAKHNHFTPFTHCVITLRERVPIFVARQRFKHTVGFTYNEVSRRYVDSDPEFFTPDTWRGRPEVSVKQGSSEIPITGELEKVVDNVYDNALATCEYAYKTMLSIGVAPEQARMVLPQSMYTEYYVTGSLFAFARAYKLRADPHAQQEIQELAKQWDEIIRPLFPVSWSSLVDPVPAS